MVGSDSTKGSYFWPKLLLWGFVILAGVLYLTDIEDKAERYGHGRGTSQPVDTAPLAEAGAGQLETTAIPSAESAAVPDMSEQPQPTSFQTEQAAPAEPLLAQPGTHSGAGAKSVESVDVQTPPAAEPPALLVDAASEALQTAPEVEPEQKPAASLALPPAAPVVEQGTAVASELPASVTIPGAASQRSPVAPAAPRAGMPETEGARSEERRARIRVEYEAARRRYQEQMRRYWESFGTYRPYRPAPPYRGYPGYPRVYD